MNLINQFHSMESELAVGACGKGQTVQFDDLYVNLIARHRLRMQRSLDTISTTVCSFGFGCGSGIEPVSCYQKIAGSMPFVCMLKGPWERYRTPNCS